MTTDFSNLQPPAEFTMIDRSSFGIGAMAALSAALFPTAANAHQKFELEPRFLPQTVSTTYDQPAGTIVVAPHDRFLYLMEDRGSARRYGIGVGRAGLTFSVIAKIGRKPKWPSWRPTDNMIRRDPKKHARYAEECPVAPAIRSARALYPYRAGRDTLYRLHGTTEPWTIGKAVSNGCIRMMNEHVEDLYERVPVGARVVVVT